MGNLEFIYSNYLNTTTMVYVSTGTATAAYLFDRSTSKYYESSGDNSDLTTTVVSVTFSSSYILDKIVLQDINLKSFKIYYNSNSANLFTLDSTCETNATEWTGNSSTNLYLKVATPITITSLQIEATATMDANEEKRIGEMWLSKSYLTFDRNPEVSGYKPISKRKQYIHEMSDGGTSVYVIGDNYQNDIRVSYVSATQRAALKTAHDSYSPFLIVPEPTGTAWVGDIYEVNWVNDWDGDQYSENYKGNGYNIKIQLKETPK